MQIFGKKRYCIYLLYVYNQVTLCTVHSGLTKGEGAVGPGPHVQARHFGLKDTLFFGGKWYSQFIEFLHRNRILQAVREQSIFVTLAFLLNWKD